MDNDATRRTMAEATAMQIAAEPCAVRQPTILSMPLIRETLRLRCP